MLPCCMYTVVDPDSEGKDDEETCQTWNWINFEKGTAVDVPVAHSAHDPNTLEPVEEKGCDLRLLVTLVLWVFLRDWNIRE